MSPTFLLGKYDCSSPNGYGKARVKGPFLTTTDISCGKFIYRMWLNEPMRRFWLVSEDSDSLIEKVGAMSKHRFGHLEIPLQRVHTELTNVCDFNCRFCLKSEMKRPFGFMETDLAKGVITEISSNHICEKITLHIMGEPTIHPDFFEILDHPESVGVKVGLTMNGGAWRQYGQTPPGLRPPSDRCFAAAP